MTMFRKGRGRGNWRSSSPRRPAPAPTAPVPPPPVPPPSMLPVLMPLDPTPPDVMPGVDNPPKDTLPVPDPELNNQSPNNLDLIKQDISTPEIKIQDISTPERDSEDMNGLDVHDPNTDIVMEDQEGQVVMSDKNGCMQGVEEEKATYKPPWRRPKGIRLKRKKVPGVKNRRIKKYAQPKNAVMCLNELDPGIIYTTEQEGSISQPFCISVEINGRKYRGFGSSKQLARQAAAEAALISFVKPPVGTADSQEEDKTPWATIVSFAMYKLFNDWREGRVGMRLPPSLPYGAAIPSGSMLADFKAFFTQPAVAAAAVKEERPQVAMFMEAISAHLGDRASNIRTADSKTTEPKMLPKPAKQIPEGASSMHPVMVLNQMKPGVQYNVSESASDGRPFFIITADIDGKEFCGEGTNVKKAKLSLAKAAIQGLYGIESTFGC